MRLWTLHPALLDARGLVALWREGLLARKVLRGRTAGYRHHPQLERFRACARPLHAVDAYLWAVHAEATARGYAFDAGKLGPRRRHARLHRHRGPARATSAATWAKLRCVLRPASAAPRPGRLRSAPAVPRRPRADASGNGRTRVRQADG